MKIFEEYESTLKQLDRLAQVAHAASRAVEGLEEKLRYQRLERKINEARKSLRTQYYEVQDACEVAAAIKCSCPLVTVAGGLRLPMVRDANCKATEHPNF
jgi:hypothetical protein